MPKGSFEWEYNPEEGLTLHIRPMFRGLVSDETRAHLKASRKEVLIALRMPPSGKWKRRKKRRERAGQR